MGLAGSVCAQTSVRGGTRTGGRDAIIAEIERARARLGPFYALTRIDIGDIGQQYTEDILNLAETAKPTLDAEDFMISVGFPAKLFFVPSKTFATSVELYPTYRWYAKTKENRRFNYYLRGDTHFMFNRLYIDLNVSKADQRVRDRSELSQLVTRDALAFGGLAQVFVTSKTSLSASGRLDDVDYPASEDQPAGIDLQQLKRQEATFGVFLHHEFTKSTRAAIEAEISSYDFDSSNLDSDHETVYLTLARGRAENQLDLRLGYTRLDYHDPLVPDDDGLLGRIEWRTLGPRRISLVSSASRSIEFSTYGENGHYTSDRLGVKAIWHLGRHLELDALAQIGTNDYPAPTLRPGVGLVNRKDDTQTLGCGFMVYLNDWLGLGLGVTAWERDSNFDELDEDGVDYSLRFSLGI